jgi:hypothetical protein
MRSEAMTIALMYIIAGLVLFLLAAPSAVSSPSVKDEATVVFGVS